jgi:hypothetical protein
LAKGEAAVREISRSRAARLAQENGTVCRTNYGNGRSDLQKQSNYLANSAEPFTDSRAENGAMQMLVQSFVQNLVQKAVQNYLQYLVQISVQRLLQKDWRWETI